MEFTFSAFLTRRFTVYINNHHGTFISVPMGDGSINSKNKGGSRRTTLSLQETVARTEVL